jgi:hypothetical protein
MLAFDSIEKLFPIDIAVSLYYRPRRFHQLDLLVCGGFDGGLFFSGSISGWSDGFRFGERCGPCAGGELVPVDEAGCAYQRFDD